MRNLLGTLFAAYEAVQFFRTRRQFWVHALPSNATQKEAQ